jgi:hypothetical protein
MRFEKALIEYAGARYSGTEYPKARSASAYVPYVPNERAEPCRGVPPRALDWNKRQTGAPRHWLQRPGSAVYSFAFIPAARPRLDDTFWSNRTIVPHACKRREDCSQLETIVVTHCAALPISHHRSNRTGVKRLGSHFQRESQEKETTYRRNCSYDARCVCLALRRCTHVFFLAERQTERCGRPRAPVMATDVARPHSLQ